MSSLFKAEGMMAIAISEFLEDYEIYFFSTLELKYRFQEFEDVVNSVDVIHWLVNRSSVSQKALNVASTKKQITTIHHLCPQEHEKLESAKESTFIHVVAKEWKDLIDKDQSLTVILARLGIDTNQFSKGSIRNLKKHIPVIGMMGFYPGAHNRKRPDIAFKALALLKQKSIKFKVLLQGAGWEDYKEQLENLDVPYTILNYSSKEESDAFFKKVDVFLCTSDFEGGPLPVLEAMASGIPVVSTEVGVAQEILINGGGFLCEKGNSKQIAHALEELINNRDLYAAHSDKAKENIKELDWGNLKEEYSEMYNRFSVDIFKESLISLSAKNQRKKELLHSKLQEGMSLLYYGDKKEGLKKLNKIKFDSSISLKRKLDTLKRVMKFSIQGVRT